MQKWKKYVINDESFIRWDFSGILKKGLIQYDWKITSAFWRDNNLHDLIKLQDSIF